MKKILLFLCLAFSCLLVKTADAQCPAGQCQITVLVEGDAFMTTDPTTFDILVNGIVVAAEVPTANNIAYTYDLGCLNPGDVVQFQYVDGFGDGIAGPGAVYPNMINYFKDGYQVFGEDVGGTAGLTAGYTVMANDPQGQGCAAPSATGGGLSADPTGLSISAAGDGSDCFADLAAVPPPIGGVATPADAATPDITQCLTYTPAAGINNFLPLGGAAVTFEYNSEAATGNDCGAFTQTSLTVTNITGGTCTLLAPRADGSYIVSDTDTYEVCVTGNLAGSTTQEGDDICLITTIAACGIESTVVCPDFNAVSYGTFCNGYDICFGYADADMDGIGDLGEDPTGTTMTVADGIAISTAQAPINDGIFQFDSDNDGVNDAVGYCLTVLFDNPTCDPEPYTPLVTLVCPDGSEATFEGATVTDYDILANAFGVPGGTAIYPSLVGILTPPVCPAMPDGSDAVAGNVEVFVADAAGDPTGVSCLVVSGPTPACDTDNTADSAANAVPVQFNPTNDPLFTALAGSDSFSCGLNATADLSSACGACDVTCETYNAIALAAGCNIFDICIGYIDVDQNGLSDVGGADPMGTLMAVDFGAATGGTLVNDGLFAFDSGADMDPNTTTLDATGYCVTYVFDVQGCDPIPYSGLVTLMCPDGTEGVLDVGTGAIALTDADVVGGVFGVVGGGAFYPVLTATTTPAVCPTMTDNSDGVAASVAVTSPDGTVCTTIMGDAPLCDATGGNAAEVVQLNPIADPLLSALFGAGTFACTIDETADLTYTCPACMMPPTCAVAGDLATAPAPPVVVESTCQADGTTVSGGSIGTITCPTGSTAQYSIDGGATFTAAPPAYNQTGPAQTITVNCLCDEDGMTSSPTAMVTTVPGSCPPPVCSISAAVTSMCDDAGTPDDDSDDITTYTITVTGSNTGAGFTASVAPDSGALTYGTPLTYTVMGSGGLNVVFTDDTDDTCTATVNQSSGCLTIENIPTVGEWGLIMLGLMMSITAIVGIRQRREEEAMA